MKKEETHTRNKSVKKRPSAKDDAESSRKPHASAHQKSLHQPETALVPSELKLAHHTPSLSHTPNAGTVLQRNPATTPSIDRNETNADPAADPVMRAPAEESKVSNRLTLQVPQPQFAPMPPLPTVVQTSLEGSAVPAQTRDGIQHMQQKGVVQRQTVSHAAPLRLPTGRFVQRKDIHKLQAKAGPNFDAQKITFALWYAMKGGTGVGTDEEKIFKSLRGLTKQQAEAVETLYVKDYGRTLRYDLADSRWGELSGAHRLLALALLDCKPERADAISLYIHMNGSGLNVWSLVTGMGTDEESILLMLRNKSEPYRQKMIKEYATIPGARDMVAEVLSEFENPQTMERARLLLEGKQKEADVVALKQAIHSGLIWSDTDTIERIFLQIEQDVEVQTKGKGLSHEQKQELIDSLRMEIETLYNKKKEDKGEKGSLQEDLSSNISVKKHNVIKGIQGGDSAVIDASHMKQEYDSYVYVSDENVNALLHKQYERALVEVQRQRSPDRQALMLVAKVEGWNLYKLEAELRKFDRETAQLARPLALQKMETLRKTYSANYSKWGRRTLDGIVHYNTMGVSKRKGETLLAQGGYLSPVQELDFALDAWMMSDTATIKRVLRGRTPEEIQQIKDEWSKTHDKSLEDTLHYFYWSGRDRFDIDMLLQGGASTPEQEMKQQRERVAYELENESYFVGDVTMAVLQNRLADLENSYNDLLCQPSNTSEYRSALEEFRRRSQNLTSAIEGHRTEVDSLADSLSTAAQLTVVIGAAIFAGVFSGGTGTAGVIAGYLSTSGGAALTVVAATTSGMAVEYQIKGDAYGIGEMLRDGTVGMIDSAVAGLTFGTSKGLTETGKHFLRRMAASKNLESQRLAKTLLAVIEEGKESLPSALVDNAINPENYNHGNPVANIMIGTGVNVGTSSAMTAGISNVGLPKMKNRDVIDEQHLPMPRHKSPPLEVDPDPLPSPTTRQKTSSQTADVDTSPSPTNTGRKVPPQTADVDTSPPSITHQGSPKQSSSTGTNRTGKSPTHGPVPKPHSALAKPSPATYKQIDTDRFWQPEWGLLMKYSFYKDVLKKLRQNPNPPITPGQLQAILVGYQKDHQVMLKALANLNSFLSQLSKAGQPLRNLDGFVAGLAHSDPMSRQAAQFLLSRVVTTSPKKITRLAQLDHILDKFRLNSIEVLRLETRATYPDFDDQDIFNALADITRRIDGDQNAIVELMDLTGDGKLDMLGLQVIVRMMGDGPHSIRSVREHIAAHNAPLPDRGQDFHEVILERVPGSRQAANGEIKVSKLDLFRQDGRVSGSLLATMFRMPNIMQAAVHNVVGDSKTINFSAWRNVENAMKALDVRIRDKNRRLNFGWRSNILGEYWEQINLKLLHNKYDDVENIHILAQVEIKIEGQSGRARIDGCILEIDEANNTITLKLQEYKASDTAPLTDAQKVVRKRLAFSGKSKKEVEAMRATLKPVLPSAILARLNNPTIKIEGELEIIRPRVQVTED